MAGGPIFEQYAVQSTYHEEALKGTEGSVEQFLRRLNLRLEVCAGQRRQPVLQRAHGAS